jgi:hypothetical protein
MEFKIVRKGESIGMPVNHSNFQWVNLKAKQNGILIISPENTGLFINEEKFRKLIKTFDKAVEEAVVEEVVEEAVIKEAAVEKAVVKRAVIKKAIVAMIKEMIAEGTTVKRTVIEEVKEGD